MQSKKFTWHANPLLQDHKEKCTSSLLTVVKPLRMLVSFGVALGGNGVAQFRAGSFEEKAGQMGCSATVQTFFLAPDLTPDSGQDQ